MINTSASKTENHANPSYSYPFKHRCVQDLAWVIHSPPLISGTYTGVTWWDQSFFAQEYAACLPALQKLDNSPTPLLDTLQQLKSQRLGHYFEALVNFWLTISPNFQPLVANQALRHQGKTLGELDFLIQELSTGKIIHLEVAVKFYLGHGDLNNMANWHGPGLRDRLDIKYQHLVEHQTQLSRKHPELLEHQVDEQACLLKGRLFYPDNSNPKTVFAANNHLNGCYLSVSELATISEQYVIPLQKNNWLAPLTDIGNNQTLEAAMHNPLDHQLTEPKCYAIINNCAEIRRFFLLPDKHWEQNA